MTDLVERVIWVGTVSHGRIDGFGRGGVGAVRRSGDRRVAAVVAGLAVVAVVMAGCSRGTGETGGPGTPTVSAPALDARASAEQQALAAYRGMWQAYAKAGLTANPDEPDLARYAADKALTTLRDGLMSTRSKGHVIKGEYGSSPRVADASPVPDPTTVNIADCLDDSRFLAYTRDGKLANDTPGGRRTTTATATKVEGTWKVTTFAVQAVGTC